MQHIAYLVVGSNKGQSRVWLEGTKLMDANFIPGALIEVRIDENERVVELAVSEVGHRVVTSSSRRGEKRPVIDLCNKMISQTFAGIRKVKAVFSNGRITITAHLDEKARLECLASKEKQSVWF